MKNFLSHGKSHYFHEYLCSYARWVRYLSIIHLRGRGICLDKSFLLKHLNQVIVQPNSYPICNIFQARILVCKYLLFSDIRVFYLFFPFLPLWYAIQLRKDILCGTYAESSYLSSCTFQTRFHVWIKLLYYP